MNVNVSPNPFVATTGFTITVLDGEPPYEVVPKTVPPNPPGVDVDVGPPIVVKAPADTPMGTMIQIVVTDSASPPNRVVASARVA